RRLRARAGRCGSARFDSFAGRRRRRPRRGGGDSRRGSDVMSKSGSLSREPALEVSGDQRRRGALQVAAAALLWWTGGVATKALPAPPLPIAFYRSAFAAVALLLFLRPGWRRPTPAFAVALVSYAACLTTFVVATKWTTSANAIFLQYSGVVWVL